MKDKNRKNRGDQENSSTIAPGRLSGKKGGKEVRKGKIAASSYGENRPEALLAHEIDSLLARRRAREKRNPKKTET